MHKTCALNLAILAMIDSITVWAGNISTTTTEHRIDYLEKDIATLKKEISQVQLNNQQETINARLKKATESISIAPYYGIISESIVNTSSYNQDFKLLQQKQLLENNAIPNGQASPPTPLIQLSGRIEGQVNAASHNNSDINLSGAELDIATQITPWSTGLIAINYDHTATSPQRSNNSRLSVDRAFITLGDFNHSPLYATIGQRYVPFGQYHTFMVNGPLTQTLGLTKARSLLLGLAPIQGVYANLYAFKGDSLFNQDINSINQWGAILGYSVNNNYLQSDFGVDWIRHIADSQGMQATGGQGFSGFAANSNTEILHHPVPGINLHGRITIQPFTVIAEYTGATTEFNKNNLSYQQRGARPSAFNIEGAYSFEVLNKPSTLSIGYGQSHEALALNLPKQRYNAALNIAWWKNTITSIGWQHDKAYYSTDLGTGQGITVQPAKSTHTIISKLGIYF